MYNYLIIRGATFQEISCNQEISERCIETGTSFPLPCLCSECQDSLPDAGAPVNAQSEKQLQEMCNEYINKQMQENWKFWIVSLTEITVNDDNNSYRAHNTAMDVIGIYVHLKRKDVRKEREVHLI